MSAPVKFLFEDDFASGHPGAGAKRMIAAAAHEAAIARAEAEGYRKGLAAAEARIEGRAAAASERIAQAIATMAQGLAAIEARLEAESVEVAVAVAGKLAPELIAAEPLAEISALASSCFHQLIAAPHVVVRIAEQLYESAQARLGEIARLSGFEGRLVVLAEPGMALGDCRIEWADGGLSRDRSATEAAISDAIGRYVAARRGAA
ncbi:MAG: flagellar assembly protein H [Alphaproteobacteria bacterium]|nr:MAG: flagellar assembly protein H [Alphaproteobacteria bacterium]